MILTAIAALFLQVSAASSVQTNTQPLTTSESPEPVDEQICVSSLTIHQVIVLGRGGKKIEITLGGGACEPPGSGISTLSARFAGNDSDNDHIIASSCPAYQTQIAKLWSAQRHEEVGLQRVAGIRVGPFTISGRSDLFDLKSPNGKKAAERWLRETLFIVRPCWNNFRSDRTRYVVDDLYRSLERNPR